MKKTDSAHNKSLNLDYGTLCRISRLQVYQDSGEWATLKEELLAEKPVCLSHPHTGASSSPCSIGQWTMGNKAMGRRWLAYSQDYRPTKSIGVARYPLHLRHHA